MCKRLPLSIKVLYVILLFYSGGYCELSEIEMRDLKPNLDFNLDQRFLLYTWDFNEVQCYGSPEAKFPPPTNNCKN